MSGPRPLCRKDMEFKVANGSNGKLMENFCVTGEFSAKSCVEGNTNSPEFSYCSIIVS